MMISTISFEIHNFITHSAEQFLVLDTPENQEFVFSYMFPRDENTKKSIRGIQLTQMFDFQFDAAMRMPFELVTDDTWLRLLEAQPELLMEIEEVAPVANNKKSIGSIMAAMAVA